MTRSPSRLSSMAAFSSPIWWRWRRKASRRLWLSRMETTAISGTQANTISVSGTLAVHKITKEAAILMAAMKNSSGQWWANSVTSNRSLVMRPMICPTLVLE